MNQKKYIVPFVVAASSIVVLAGCSVTTTSTPVGTSTSTESSQTSSESANMDGVAALLTNTTIVIPGTNISVVINKPGVPIAYGQKTEDVNANYGTVTLASKALKLGNNIVTTFTVNRAGKDRDLYIALFRNGQNGWEMTRTKSIGTNIDLQDISISRQGVTIQYLQRGPDQAPGEAPNVPVTKTFSISDGQIQEVQQ